MPVAPIRSFSADGALGSNIKADKDVIKRVTQQKKALEKQIRAAYAAQIKGLEDQIKLLQKKGASKPKG
jgi:hypothetical protein